MTIWLFIQSYRTHAGLYNIVDALQTIFRTAFPKHNDLEFGLNYSEVCAYIENKSDVV